MQVKNKNNGDRGTFYMEDGDKEIGILHYTMRSATEMVIDHTEVDEEYEGRGLGRQLVKAGVEYARENQLKILPTCPFARKVFEMTPDFADVLF